jgi:hypothetical protein
MTLEDKSKEELYKIAIDEDITGRGTATRQELISMIRASWEEKVDFRGLLNASVEVEVSATGEKEAHELIREAVGNETFEADVNGNTVSFHVHKDDILLENISKTED